MITIPLLTEKDLDIFRGKKVLLYGVRMDALVLYRVFKHFNIEVIGYCIEERVISKWEKTKNKLMGFPHIEVANLESILTKYDNVIVQRTDFDAARLMLVQAKMKELGLKCSPFTRGELVMSFSYIAMVKRFERFFFYQYKSIRRKLPPKRKPNTQWKAFQKMHPKSPIVICTPAKTADYALGYTFEMLNQKASVEKRIADLLDYFNVWHSPMCINRSECEEYFETLKILVGVREPISQNVSILYQMISAGDLVDPFMWMELESGESRKNVIDKYKNLFGASGNDVQNFWSIYTEIYTKIVPSTKRKEDSWLIQWFMVLFNENILDITNYPFNQEKGYTIIKEGNTEVFIYQLEKLNSLVLELSEWIGVPFGKLENGNQASDKWIAESYKQAQQEIEITQQYFDKCFNEPYVKHCYSEADIKKFKARWQPHIKNEVQAQRRGI